LSARTYIEIINTNYWNRKPMASMKLNIIQGAFMNAHLRNKCRDDFTRSIENNLQSPYNFHRIHDKSIGSVNCIRIQTIESINVNPEKIAESLSIYSIHNNLIESITICRNHRPRKRWETTIWPICVRLCFTSFAGTLIFLREAVVCKLRAVSAKRAYSRTNEEILRRNLFFVLASCVA